ncbi:hypothetical protein [Riemerella anatipestifer]|uniref:hypothetical protein n=2 Tax=Riemerella anatipestifer TaxID=34085 RepID=UPI001BDA9A42|nr:hypothetical protein [Riemerella anatipestifer]MBT0551688.1 hypothetical protein [Riemerella anatipestifer]MBT0553869.1 hypothetical protein [Riemerella anatipestifer]MCE3024354.1 hypothetical protein [Riemerella anatipestifer]MDY3387500.1 hypothetical protein [Riemerella anatipestifer]QYR03876.1 hypothetical protein J6M00_05560 [Riemerella anatipestifer]
MTFLNIAHQKSKKMYYFFVGFIVLTLISHVFRTSSIPFFIYAMYSAPVPIQNDFSFFVIKKSDGKIFNHPEIWNHHKRIVFYYSSRTWEQLLGQDKPRNCIPQKVYPSADKNYLNTHYPKWLFRYVQQVEGRKLDHITLYKVTVNYDEHNKYSVKYVEKIFTQGQ